uniref:Uncharacterized protein n=1 Tax=Anguilla anguilla TaxID=7936 RepID=A0A0E9S1W0_ANGAN
MRLAILCYFHFPFCNKEFSALQSIPEQSMLVSACCILDIFPTACTLFTKIHFFKN